MLRNTSIAFFVLTTALFHGHSVAAPEIKGSPLELKNFLHPSDKIISITADAELSAFSDKATISLVVTTEQKRLSDAMAENTQLRNNIVKQLTAVGVDEKAINSAKFSSSPEYGWFGSQPKSFKVINRMSIAIMEERHLQEIAKLADDHVEVELATSTFEHTEKETFSLKVKQLALDKVLKQKTFYEQALGIKLQAVGLHNARVFANGTRGAEEVEMMLVTRAKKVETASSYDVRNRSAEQRSSSFDEVEYKANIVVDFKIVE